MARERGAWAIYGGIHATLFPEEALERARSPEFTVTDSHRLRPSDLGKKVGCRVQTDAFAVVLGGEAPRVRRREPSRLPAITVQTIKPGVELGHTKTSDMSNPTLQKAPAELSLLATAAAMKNKQSLMTLSVSIVRSNTSSLARRCCEDRSDRAALCDELAFRVWRRFV